MTTNENKKLALEAIELVNKAIDSQDEYEVHKLVKPIAKALLDSIKENEELKAENNCLRNNKAANLIKGWISEDEKAELADLKKQLEKSENDYAVCDEFRIKLREELSQIIIERDKYKAALEFYAFSSPFELLDYIDPGEVAREALKPESEG